MSDPRYLYAVCRPWSAPLQTDLRGVAGTPPRELRHDALVAVVSTVPARDFAGDALRARLADPRWRSALTRAHEAVVAALTTVTTPLPVRPGAVFPDDSAVRVLLAAEHERLTRALDRLADRVEWTVTVRAPGPESAPDAPDAPHPVGTGTVAGAGGASGVSGADEGGGTSGGPDGGPPGPARELHERLAALADEYRRDPPDRSGEPSGVTGEVPSRVAYLVPRTLCEEFVEEVGRYRAGPARPPAELSGPWAPYSFTPAPYGGD
ncbi:GvpL/GvpF family gas vesicle protein [Streptomyces sp. JNUCC 64]